MRKHLLFSFHIPKRSFNLRCLSPLGFYVTKDLISNPSLFRSYTTGSSSEMDSLTPSESSRTYSRVEYMPLEDVENPARYRPGGYHPLAIGDRLHNRYDVVHKLGFGTNSTTWLARDEKAKKYVAVKIGTADGDAQESKILDTLTFPNTDHKTHPGQALISLVLDEFTVSGPNGKHKCLVTEPGMMSLADAKDASYSRLFQLPVAKAITAQIIQAVAFLHSQGIVHSDLHAGNILLRLPKSIDDISPEQLYEKYGKPNTEPIVRVDGRPLPEGVPSYGIVPIWLGKASDLVTLSEAKIIITDFGESFLPSITERHYSNTPAILAPPEIYFSPQQISFPSDIWTLACTLWDIIGQRPLFEGFNPSKDWMIKEHVDTIGKLPCDWWKKWDARQRWFTEEGARIHGESVRSLVDRFDDSVREPRQKHAVGELGEAERADIFSMFQDMLKFRPEERLTAAQVAESEWMLKWAPMSA